MQHRRHNRREQGNGYETQVCDWFTEHGWNVLLRNVYTPFGELDIVVYQEISPHQYSLAFVEVKGRRKVSSWNEDAVSLQKQQRILQSIDWLLQENSNTESVQQVLDHCAQMQVVVVFLENTQITVLWDAFPA